MESRYKIPVRCDCREGDSIEGKYFVISELGSGSFGQVFKVKNREGGIAALKLLRLWDVVADIREPLIARFEMEFKTGCIASNNIVHSFDYGFYNGNPYFVMEFCQRGDISKYAGAKDCNFSKYAIDILSGLNDLHINGKVHRDLKPENVLLREDGTAVLTDFGISGDRNRRMTERNIFGRPYQIFGTYAYMAPEQAKRERGNATVLPTTDLFSFGVLMYQLLTGSLPFGPLENENDLAKYLIRSKAGQWDRELLLAMPGGALWNPLISACLKPSWKERVQSARDAMRLVPQMPVSDSKPVEIKSVSSVVNEEADHESGTFLKVMFGFDYGHEFDLNKIMSDNKSLVRVGVGPDNDILLTDFDGCNYTSRYHFTIEKCRNDVWIIRDGQWRTERDMWQRSTNGTWLNSSEVGDLGNPLSNGDIISVGDIKIRFKIYK